MRSIFRGGVLSRRLTPPRNLFSLSLEKISTLPQGEGRFLFSKYSNFLRAASASAARPALAGPMTLASIPLAGSIAVALATVPWMTNSI